jgi:O-antigen/teichoic acid export membrane protein
MGIIQRQSIKNTIISFIAAFVGAVNVLIIYERLLTPDQLGKVKFIVSTAFLLVPFVMLGVTTTMLRFFPKFKNEDKGHHGILGFGLLYTLMGYAIYLLLTFIFFSYLPDKFQSYYGIISILLLFVAFSSVLTSYLASLKKIVVPTFFNNLWVKIGVPGLVIAYYLDWLTFEDVEWNIISVYAIATLGLFFYIKFLGQLFLRPKSEIFDNQLKSDIKAYALYSTLGPMGAVLMTQLDQFMVTEILDFNSGGVYTIAVYFGSLFTIPLMSVFSIANPIISDASDRGDDKEIQNIYKKSSITLMVVGFLLFLLIWTSIDDVFGLMSKGDVYAQGKIVILFLAIAKIVDMSTSVNGAIIAHSKYFRFNLYALLLLGIVNVFANYFFIKSMNINGAALATLSSLTLYNAVKGIYVWKKFKMQPFTGKSLILLGIGAFVFLISLQLTYDFSNAFLAIIIKSIIVGGMFSVLVYVFNISPDINQLIINLIKKIIR